MKILLDCYPCMLRHTLTAIRKTGMEESYHINILRQVMRELIEIDENVRSPEISARIQSIVRERTGREDIYEEEKDASTREALALYPSLKNEILNSSDPFETAVRLCIAGNIIDYGSLDSYDLDETIQRVKSQPFALNGLEYLRKAIESTDRILFLADNAGETVFDRLLIETIGKPVTYAVKEAPILNDATREDARAAGLESVAEVISCGARCPGTLLSHCSNEFVERFRKAELIIAKGMGNYEALSNEAAPIFFLLQVKCELIGRDLNVPKGSIVAARAENYPKVIS